MSKKIKHPSVDDFNDKDEPEFYSEGIIVTEPATQYGFRTYTAEDGTELEYSHSEYDCSKEFPSYMQRPLESESDPRFVEVQYFVSKKSVKAKGQRVMKYLESCEDYHRYLKLEKEMDKLERSIGHLVKYVRDLKFKGRM